MSLARSCSNLRPAFIHRPFLTAAALALLFVVPGCGSDDTGASASPTPTTAPVTASPTDPVLCSVFGIAGGTCTTQTPGATPTPALPPCSGAMETACTVCGGPGGCCDKGRPPQCFDPQNGLVGTLCNDDPAAACIVVSTPTPTATASLTATATVTATATASATPTATDTPDGGIPTPTLPPNTCDAACGDNGPPTPCATLTPNADGIDGTPPDLLVDSCLVVGNGAYAYRYVNVIDGGTLYFADQSGTIDFRANSVLVQKGGTVKAGSWCCPFGSYGGELEIGLWGIDPTDQGTMPPSTPGIDCVDMMGKPDHCFPAKLVATPNYCTVQDSDDPCSSPTPPAVGDNALFEGHLGHGDDFGLPFDRGSSFGYKVFAVSYGGSLELFGAKGVAAEHRSDPSVQETSCPVPSPTAQHDPTAWAASSGESWARLDGSTLSQATSLTIDRAVNWEQGDRLVVTSTDWHTSHSEEVTIAGLEAGNAFSLNAPLGFAHSGELYDVTAEITDPPSANHQIETRAAVGLLSRDIRVYSLGDTYDQPFPESAGCGYQADKSGVTTPANCYFGGHVIARQGFRTFQVQGVEFAELGQGGRLGHYPVHFHLAKSTAYTNAFLKDSSIHTSMNRFVTIHGTHDVEVSRNVGYLSVGHGYYLEDGSEIDNLLCNNLAVSVQGSQIEYLQAQDPQSPTYRFSPPILPSAQSGPPYGSDASMPVAFWTMNTWNDLVGNTAVGVGGFGSCFWLLGSGVSGPSQFLQWSTSTTTPDGYANYNQASTRQAPLKRFRGNSCSTSQYALQSTLQVDPAPPVNASTYGFTATANPYDMTSDLLPNVAGDFLPVLIGGVGCATQRTASDTGDNAAACSLTLLDRFTASFNWAPIDFGSIWLRPQFYAFTNGAVTDQLFGGLTFVSGGAWTQAPAGYFTITSDSLYVGSTQPDSPDAGHLGPALDIGDCASAGCPLPLDGTALPLGGFQPKRLINIYDGPFFAERNAFAETPGIVCDPTKVTGGNPECGIYMSTVQPKSCDGLPSVMADPSTAGGMCVLSAAVGWKQPNGFFYPPAFAFEHTAFDDNTIRHNVVDQYDDYIQGTVTSPPAPMSFDPLRKYNGITPIDSSTILNDLDGTFTGNCWGDDCDSLPASSPQRRTSSVSANHFFDAPSQTPECQSFGVQTAPTDFLTSVIAPLTADGSAIDPGVWSLTPPFPAVPIYRQLLLEDEMPCTGAICDGETWSCNQAAFMMGAQNGQAPYLTANHGVYYIDTDTSSQTTSCILGGTFEPASFTAGSSYVLYQLFAKDDSKTTYQLYVGDAAAGQWVWVQPHLSVAGGPSNNLAVEPIADPTLLAKLTPNAKINSGVLEVVFDSSLIADQFSFTARADDEKCVPRDACQVATDGSKCELATAFSESGLEDVVGSICEKWATRVAGTTATSGSLSLSDCPASGCLGYSFTLPTMGWEPTSYADVGAGLTTCFPDDAAWDRPLQVISQDQTVCSMPPAPAGFCPAPTPTPTP